MSMFDESGEENLLNLLSGSFGNDSHNEELSPSMVPQADSQQDFSKVKIKPRNVARKIYLITYSQADLAKMPSRESFAEAICDEFNRNDLVVLNWVCSLESHRVSGIHFHLALQLRMQRRWSAVRVNVKAKHGIDIDFREWEGTYYDAFNYATKFDKHAVQSPGHPLLKNPPRTSAAITAKRELALDRASETAEPKSKRPYKPPQLKREDVGRLCVEHGIKTDDELISLSNRWVREGKRDLEVFIYRNDEAKREQVIATAWKMEKCEDHAQRKAMSKMDILKAALEMECSIDRDNGIECNGRWLKAALDVLEKNEVPQRRFADLVVNALTYGRGKGRNLMITGATSRAKSFLLMPLTVIYDTFTCPAGGTYNWVKAPSKEIIFLNDIRYDKNGEKRVMTWQQFLNLLDGSPVQVSMPKNFFSSDVQWTAKQPIFATADKKIVRTTGDGRLDDGETAQMDERWVILELSYRFEKPDYSLIPCGRCFAELVLQK